MVKFLCIVIVLTLLYRHRQFVANCILNVLQTIIDFFRWLRSIRNQGER